MNDFFQINSSSSVPILKRKQASLNKGTDYEASFETVVECLSFPSYMRNINHIKRISKWVIKNSELFSKIHNYRLQNDALKNEDEDNLIIAILCSSNIEVFQESQTLYNIKDKPEKMYIILEGTLEVFVQPKQLHSLTSLIKSKEICEGNSVGDMDLFSNTNRNSTVIAQKKCILLSIKKNIFDAHILEFYQYNFTDVMNFIFNLKVFDGISNKHLFIKSFYDAYSQQLKYSQGQLVFSEKNQPDYVYFILTGSFLVKRQIEQEKLRSENQNQVFSASLQNSKQNSNKQTEFDLNINYQKTQKIQINLFQLEKGDFFGEEDIIEHNSQRTFQVQCCSILGGELLQFNREVFENIFMKHFAIEQFFVLNLPIKRKLIADKIYQNSKVLKATIPKENSYHHHYFDKEKRESRYQIYPSLDSMNNIASQKGSNINNYTNQQYDKSITSLSYIPKNIDEIQEEREQYDEVKNKNNYQRSQKNFKVNCIGSMSELLDYAQKSIQMLHQNQQITNAQEQQNQIQDMTLNQKYQDTMKPHSNKIGLYYLPTKKRISSNDLCYQIENQSDENLQKQSTINSIKKKMSQTFDYNMNNFMRDKIQLQKNVVFQQKKNKQKIIQVQTQKQNGQRSKSDENQISTMKRKSKPTVTKWTNSLNQKDEEMVIQGEMSKQFQKNLKQICYKFGKQDFDSLKMSLKNHIKDKNFKKILNANICNAKGFQTNYNSNYDRSKGINDLSEKIQYVQKVQDKMSQKIFNLESSQLQRELDYTQNVQFNQNEFQQLQKSQSSQNFFNQNLALLDSQQKPNQQSKNDKLEFSVNLMQKVQSFSEKNPNINQISFGMNQSPKSSIDYLEPINKESNQLQQNTDSIDEHQEILKVPKFNQNHFSNKFQRNKNQNVNEIKQINSSNIGNQIDLSQEYLGLKMLKMQQKISKQEDKTNLEYGQNESQKEINQNRQQQDNNLTQNKICSIFNSNNKFIEENEKTINSPQSDQNTPSSNHPFSTFQTQYAINKNQSEQNKLFQQKFNKLRPYSSSYHQSPVSQINQGAQNITQNYYPIDYYQKANYISETEQMRPSSCKSRSTKNLSQNFIKLQNSKLNQQISKQYQFRDKKQMNALLNIKKQFQNQNKSFSPNNNAQNQMNKINAQSYLHMIQSHKKYETKEQFNFDSPKVSQFPSSEQLQDLHSDKSQKLNNQNCNQNQMQSKSQLNQNLNNSLAYFQQYIIHPQQQNIKYHFHRKVISDVSKCNINNPQLSKFFQQQSSLTNNNNTSNQIHSQQIKQQVYLQQPQQIQKNNSIMINNTNQQRLNILSRESGHQEQTEIIKQENQQNESYPTLFSPDIFYSPQHAKKQRKFINLNNSQISQNGECFNLKEISQQSTKNLSQNQIKIPKKTIDQEQQTTQTNLQIDETPKQAIEKSQKNIETTEQAKEKCQQSVEAPLIIIEKCQYKAQTQEQTEQNNQEENNNQQNITKYSKIKKNQIEIKIPPKKINIDFQLMLENQKQKQIEEENKIESPPLLQSNQTNSYENQTPQFQIVKNFNFLAKQISLNSSVHSHYQNQDFKTSFKSINQDSLEQNNNQEDIQKTEQKSCVQVMSQTQIDNSTSLEQNLQQKQFISNSLIEDFNLQKKLNSQLSIIETINSQKVISNQDQSSYNYKSSLSEIDQKYKSQKQIQNKSIEQENQQLKNNICKNDQNKGQQNRQQLFKNPIINQTIPIINEEQTLDQFNQEQVKDENLNKPMLNGSMTSNISQFQNFIDSPSLIRFRNNSQFSQNSIHDQISKQNLIDAPSLIRFRNASQFSINNINDQISKPNLIDAPSLIRFRNNTQFSTNNINEQISKQSLLFGQNDLVYFSKANKNETTQKNMLEVLHHDKYTHNYQNQNLQIIDNNDNYPVRQKSKSAYNKL
ncbi:aldehyde dehydrogenase (NAD) family protein (macronuclear) [Tetrahymena thermophila SB210]|uniref:Aldehyde dehydrogenase (NAD) family protein n=1 Tax=Tetrahymena thermophila (strain SB210) TaxID=312017 RepID=Q22BE4_TETTS|nr:aldehyde dehydrogenase (NAD) family protein [Tetrahymena thermophila SB210]EAR82611.2 aldehyde dehydrogenase (NAD) family protein [Tetrahymena thermophila SB210]|eukprot:XP_001030274.2 aldehyde dehydrogenase (NAD) family protein [Tetrahymena thermophila SB210]